MPDDWYELVRNSREKNPFSVCIMKAKDFIIIKTLQSNIVNQQKKTLGEQVNWMAHNGLG